MASWTYGETILVTGVVGAALEALGVDWYVGGSVASSLHGIPRATQDADLVVALRPGQAARLAELLGSDFYMDAETAEEAIRSRRSFNVIHFDTMFKVDIFVSKADAYSRRAMADRVFRVLATNPPVEVPVATAEDTVAHKLFWYRKGGRSEKQWTDLRGVLETLADGVDVQRLRLACADLGVEDLVDSALAGINPGG